MSLAGIYSASHLLMVAAGITPGVLPVARVVAGLLLVLVLPGLALAAALPGTIRDVFDRVMLTLGLSIVTTALSGLILNATSWGLRPGSWAACLSVVTVLAGLAAILRRKMTVPTPLPPIHGVSLRQLGLLALALLLAGGAFGVARAGALRQDTPSFTELWILSATPSMRTVHVGVRSDEHSVEAYRLVVRTSTMTLRQWPAIRLKSGQTWQRTVALPHVATGIVSALLYRHDAPRVIYRRVHIWTGPR